MYWNLFDSHIHSDNSPDGVHAASFLCETAIARGFTGIAITDHCEIDRFEEQQVARRLKQAHFAVMKARAAFSQQLVVSFGVELGQANVNYALSEEMLAKYPFDFVLGSLHSVNGFNFSQYSPEEMTAKELDDRLEEYYATLMELVNWGKMDAVAHLTYPLRHVTGRHGVPVSVDRMDELLDPILRRMVEQGIGLELNASGFRQGLGEPMPSLRYLRRYHELGGETVTIGSDAHRAEDIGAGVDETMELLTRCGYDHFAFFRRRKPEYLCLL